MSTTADHYALLRDGGRVLLRAAGKDDRPRVRKMFQHLAPDQLARRFHSNGRNVDDSMIDVALGGHAATKHSS